MNTLITSIKLIAKGNIPSQVELMGKPIYENGKIKTFEIIYQDYNYDEENHLDFSIENFNMTIESLSEATYKFTNYFTFNVIEEGIVEFDLCVLVEDVHDDLLNDIDNIFTPSSITIQNFTFKDECYFFKLDMQVVEIVAARVVDIY
ncbi:hypothetical protein FJQ98_16750 [Lysinibacillus agricola]|uniref:Uncharacterized protein n=1 Tax=Lysinibacillus agricola TaxID=2590012 RepID=A0ABX7ANV7_9BACI|nr:MULTISPECIES: hypothetical protein [Lysinibacillus]KOS61425.1 hypothetical protein AN161_17680 [Lysinibacillus sp. FJAT-14222]QQP10895.1 hypothetical protein FJQ98_16750 [Lysinibacillus agricola]